MKENSFLLFMLLCVGLLGHAGTGFAEQTTVKAMAPWKGEGLAFPIGDDQVYMIAVFTGIMFVEDGQGALHAGSLACPSTVEANWTTMTKSGKGHCIISNTEGERVYAEFPVPVTWRVAGGPFKVHGELAS